MIYFFNGLFHRLRCFYFGIFLDFELRVCDFFTSALIVIFFSSNFMYETHLGFVVLLMFAFWG